MRTHPPSNDPAEPPARWLRNVPFFAGLSDSDLDEIAAAGSSAELPTGATVFREGDPADRLYVILSGRARIFKTDRDGTELTLAWLAVGEFFGELALLDGGRRSAGVVTVTGCRFFTLDRPDFLQTVGRHPDLLARLMSELTARVRESGDRALRQEMEAERVRVETELQRHRSLSRMVAGVAHELNTPLGIARTAASVLQDRLREPPDATDGEPWPVQDIREAVDLLDRNILRAHRLVQDFKSVAVGQLSDTLDVHDLVQVIREIVDLYAIEAKRVGLEIRIEDRLGDAGRWVGYRGFLNQVILNLLTNAERYAYPDGGGGRVEIDVTVDGDADNAPYRITVRDHGAGIPADALAKVFEPFYTTGRGRGGSGLGLAIVHNLVTGGLSGAIRIESEPGRGTAVHVSVPREVPG